MYCRTCGQEVQDQAVVCVSCGVPPARGNRYCWNCAAETDPNAQVCVQCGVQLPVTTAGGIGGKKKITAGLLGIFLGGFGVHRFYLGYSGIGIAQIAVTVVTCGAGALWGFIEGILILTGSYLQTDADGVPLED